MTAVIKIVCLRRPTPEDLQGKDPGRVRSPQRSPVVERPTTAAGPRSLGPSDPPFTLTPTRHQRLSCGVVAARRGLPELLPDRLDAPRQRRVDAVGP